MITDGSFDYSTGAHDRLYELSNGELVSLVHSVDGNGEVRPRHLVTDVFGSSDRGRSWKKLTSLVARRAGQSVPLRRIRLLGMHPR